MTPRTLAHIIADLNIAKRERAEAESRCERSSNASRDVEAFDSADDRLSELRDEFKSKFRDETGLSWTTVDDLIANAVL